MNIQAFDEINDAASERPPVLAVRHGRGRTGGSTFLDFLIQRGRRAGRSIMIGDGDTSNATLSSLYPPNIAGGASAPLSSELSDVTQWVLETCGEIDVARSSLVLDLGGGDRVLAEAARNTDFEAFCQSIGAEALAIYMVGPDRDDFEHVLNIFKAGYFSCSRSLLVLNHNLVQAHRNRSSAFEWLESDPGFNEMIKTAVCINMERLVPMDEMRDAGLSFYDVLDRKPTKNGKPFNPMSRFQVGVWMNQMEKQFETFNVEAWLP